MAAVFVLVAAIFVAPHPALAVEEQTVTLPISWVYNTLSRIMLQLTQLALSLMLFVLTFVIEIAGYNGYLSSTAVTVGWVMIRDLTNMVFVVALLMIAFGTILGIEHYEWKHMLFKLVSAAILVNFSRIICGILIDISQVVMITFVNGIAATVGGNFIRAFNLEKIQSFSTINNAGKINPEEVFLSSAAALFVSVTILVAMGIFLAMLLARVIVLWILIVLSPIAFVFGVLHQTEHYAQEWWSEFGKNVITGPVLIFFLWLTLATVGNGMANQEIKNASSAPKNDQIDSNSGSGVGVVLTWESLANFLIAIGMLVIGLRTTQHLGGIGASWTENAMDYGKSVTRWASGMALAQKGAQKVKEKTVETAKQYGQFAGNVASYAWTRAVREPTAKAFNTLVDAGYKDGKHKEGGLARGARTILKLAPFGVGSMYRTEMMEKMEKIAHARKAVAEDHIPSSSKTNLGTQKTYEETREEMYKKTGMVKKESKIVDAEAKIFEMAWDANENGGKKRDDRIAYLRNKYKIGKKEAVDAVEFGDRHASVIKSQVDMDEKKARHHAEEALKEGQFKEKLQSEVKLGNMELSKATGWNPVSVAAHIKSLEDNKVISKEQGDKFRDEYRLNMGVVTNVPDMPVRFDGTEATYEANKARVKKAHDEGRISDKDFAAAEKRMAFQHLQSQATLAEKENEQISKATGAARKLQEGRTEEGLRDQKGHHGDIYRERETRVAGMTTELNQIQDKLGAKRQEELLLGIKELLSSVLGKQRQDEIFTSKGTTEILRNSQENDQIMGQAQARAKVYMDQGEPLQAEAILRGAIVQVNKKYADMFGGLTYDDRMAQEVILTQNIMTERDPAKLAKLRTMRSALTMMDASSDASSSRDGLQAAATTMGFDRIDDTNSFEVMLRRETGLTDADLTGLSPADRFDKLKKAALERFKGDKRGEQQYLRGLFEAFKKAGNNGDQTLLGAVKKVYTTDPATGLKKMEFEFAADQTDANNYARTNYGTYYPEHAEPKNMESIAQLAGKSRRDASGNWRMSGITTHGRESIVAFYKNKDKVGMGRNMAPIFASWNNADIDATNVGEFVTTLTEMKNSMPPDGWAAFVDNTKAAGGLQDKIVRAGGRWPT